MTSKMPGTYRAATARERWVFALFQHPARPGILLRTIWAEACIAAAVLLSPPVLGAIASRYGVIRNPRTALALWIASALLLLAGMAGMRSGWRRWLQYVAMIAATVLFTSAGINASRAARNRVDILGSLDPASPICAQVAAARGQGGDPAALAVLGRYLQSRRPFESVTPWPLWALAQFSPMRAEKFRTGDLGSACGAPAFFWRPAMPLSWSAPTPEPLLFCLQRQMFLFDAAKQGSREALDSAWTFAEAWRRANPLASNFHPFAWGDDPTANRIQAQMMVMAARRAQGLSTPEDEIAFLRSVLQHAARLMDEQAHNYRTNHGLMQNDALLALSLAYPELDRNREWRQTAIRRMERHLRETVSPEGVFLELTPGYHWDATMMSLWFVASCHKAGVPVAPWMDDTVRKMAVFAREILQPDRTLPAIADTRTELPVDVDAWPWQDLPRWPELAALRQAFANPAQPPNGPGAWTWPGAGYFVLRARAPEWNRSTGLMATLIAGPHSLAHAHANALALTLFANGRPLLEGPGYPDYDDEARRDVLISTMSQNAVSVDGQSQPPGNAAIRRFDTQAGTVLVQAESALYPGVLHRRSLVYGPSASAILLIDELSSEKSHLYRQHFRAAPGVGFLGGEGWVESPSVLRIQTAVFTEQGTMRPLADLEPPMASFAVFERRAVFVTVLDSGGAARQPQVDRQSGSITWSGERGTVRLRLSGGMEWEANAD